MKILIEPNKNKLNNSDVQKARDLPQIYTSLFSSEYGKIVLEDLAETSGMYRSNFVADNPLLTAYLLGKKDSVLELYEKIENNISNIEGSN